MTSRPPKPEAARDARLIEALRRRGLLTEASLQRALAAARASPHEDISSLCARLTGLPLGQLEALQATLDSAARPDGFHTAALGQDTAPPANHQAPASARDLARALHDELRKNPLFAPHAELVFEAREVLGEGGMGRVRRVVDRRLGREAALKTALPGHPEAISRLLAEARLTARLDHPSIPPVFEAGVTERGEHYLLMRVIEGEDLSASIARYHSQGRPPPTLRALLEVLLKTAEAIAYAHQRGLVHRDLKPDNIRVGGFGEVMVMDWGIAFDLSRGPSTDSEAAPDLSGLDVEARATRLTQAGAVVGTPGYMAPEQATGRAADPRADVFALGAILTEILTGRPPVGGDTTLIRIVATLDGRISGPRELDRSVDRELDALARRALTADRDARMASAETFVSELRAWLSGSELNSYRYPPHERLIRLARQHTAALLATVALSLALALGGFLWSARSQLDDARSAEALVRSTLEALNEAEAIVARGHSGAELDERLALALTQTQRSEGILLQAARLYREAGQSQAARALLEEVVGRFPPAYEALLELHVLETRESDAGAELGLRLSDPMRELLKRAADDPDESEFSLIAQAIPLIRPSDPNREALDKLDRAIALNPKRSFAYQTRAITRLQASRLDEAMLDAEAALQLDPSAFLPAVLRWTVYSQRGDNERALVEVDRALNRRPSCAPILRSRALILMALGRPKLAQEDAQRAAELSPDDATSWAVLSQALEGCGDDDGAERALNRALKLNPDDLRALISRARRLIERESAFERAEALLTRALNFDPGSRQALQLRGKARLRQGRGEAALEDWERIARAGEAKSLDFLNMARVRDQLLNDREGALRDLERARDAEPNSALPWLERARWRSQEGAYTAALKDLDEALAREPNNPALRHERGKVLVTLDRYKDALREYEELTRIAPGESESWSRRSMTLMVLGRFEEALEASARAVAIAKTAETQVAHALALEKAGQLSLSLRAWREVLQAFPEAAEAQTTMAREKVKLLEATIRSSPPKGE